MKRSILLFVVMAIAVIYSGCSTPPPQINFTGTSVAVKVLDPGKTTALPNGNILIEGLKYEWYDSTSAWQATGQSIWVENWLIYSSGDTIKIWGTAGINVDGENPGDPSRGKWELLWNALVTQYEMDDQGNFTRGLITANACGKGVSGAVKGMLGHWKYTMDISKGFVYHSRGYIQ